MKISFKHLFAFAGAALMLSSNLILPTDLNPDWDAYRRIYESGGAWLADDGRDGVFLLFLSLYKSLSPLPAYESFRGLLILIFAGFVWFALSGRAIEYPTRRVLVVCLALLVLTMIRFTIQIREALALVLFFASCWCLTESKAGKQGRIWPIVSWITALLAAGTHSIGVVLLLVRVVAVFLASFNKKSRSLLLTVISVSLALGVFVLAFQGRFVSDITEIGLRRSGERDIVSSGFDTTSIIYWSIYGGIFYFLAVQQRILNHKTTPLPKELQSQAALIAGPMAFISLLTIVVLKGAAAPALVIVLFVRIFDMLIAITALYVAYLGRSYYALAAVLMLLILKGMNELQAAIN